MKVTPVTQATWKKAKTWVHSLCSCALSHHTKLNRETYFYIYRIAGFEVSKEIICPNLGIPVDWEILSYFGALQENLRKALALLSGARISHIPFFFP